MAKKEYRGKNLASAFRQARKELGAGQTFIYVDPRGHRREYNTNYKEEIPVISKATSPLISNDDARTMERRIKEAQESAANAFSWEEGIRRVQDAQARLGRTVMKPIVGSGNIAVWGQQFDDSAELPYTTSMPEITVSAPMTHITSRSAGYIPVLTTYDSNGKVYRNYETGTYYMTDPKTGEILAESPDKNVLNDKTLWTVYHNGRNGDQAQAVQSAERLAADDAMLEYRLKNENRDMNAPLAIQVDPDGNPVLDENGNYQYVGKLTTDQLVRDMNAGKNRFAQTAMTAFDDANHLVAGGLKATFDPNYSAKDYLNGFLDPSSHITGAGDLFNIENEDARFFANFINPEAIMGTVAASRLPSSRIVVEPGKPNHNYIRVQVENGGRSSYRRGSRPNEGMGTVGRNSYYGGARGKTQYGGKHMAGRGSHTEVIDLGFTLPNIHTLYKPGAFNPKMVPPPIYFNSRTGIGTRVNVPPLSVEYGATSYQPGQQYERMFGDPYGNSIAVPDALAPGNVTVNSSNDRVNLGRSSGARLVMPASADARRGKSVQDTGETDITY